MQATIKGVTPNFAAPHPFLATFGIRPHRHFGYPQKGPLHLANPLQLGLHPQVPYRHWPC